MHGYTLITWEAEAGGFPEVHVQSRKYNKHRVPWEDNVSENVFHDREAYEDKKMYMKSLKASAGNSHWHFCLHFKG